MFRSIVNTGLRTANTAAPFATRSASSFASTTFIGRVGQDLVAQESANGKRYLRYSIAVQKNREAPTNWFNITVFSEPQVDFLVNYVRKGALVHVEAAPETQVLEAEDGSKQYRVNFIQKQVNILNQAREEEEN